MPGPILDTKERRQAQSPCPGELHSRKKTKQDENEFVTQGIKQNCDKCFK